jgi:hypothetical protein
MLEYENFYITNSIKNFFIIVIETINDLNFLIHLYILFLIIMINQSNKVLNKDITKLVNQDYQYGFSTNIEKDVIEKD